MAILVSLAMLLLFQLAGELLRMVFHLPLPGPVLGMALLAAWLARSKTAIDPGMERGAQGLLSILGLLFVPAGVGVIANLALLRAAWLPIIASLILSTLLSLIVTAGTMHFLLSRDSEQAA